ncbi:putative DNA-directed RNA polymerase III subunit RPC7-like [Capsicum annuum]|nr:putative DNA-directed RNA polymerase III subunit RPC7-like [Capsicum annuum]
MAKKGGKRIFNKEEIAEDWCFDCKDGGELMICDYGKCLKVIATLDVTLILIERDHGIEHGSSDKWNSESFVQVSNMARDVCLSMLSDGEIKKEECNELKEKVKAGPLKKLTIHATCNIPHALLPSSGSMLLATYHMLSCLVLGFILPTGVTALGHIHVSFMSCPVTPLGEHSSLLVVDGKMRHCNANRFSSRGLWWSLNRRLKSFMRTSQSMYGFNVTELLLNLNNYFLRKLLVDLGVYRYIAQSQFLKTPSYLSSQLENNIPCVIPEEVELESLDTNDNQVQQCSDETTSMKQDIPRVTPEKVQLEPPAEDETDGNKTHEYANGTTPAEDGAPCSGS